MTICQECKRPTRYEHSSAEHMLSRAKASPKGLVCYIQHGGYGCDTGCCGYRIYLETVDGRDVGEEWIFDHPSDASTAEEFCREVTSELTLRGVRLDMDRCETYCYDGM